jgi:RHS repeat-associated protein
MEVLPAGPFLKMHPKKSEKRNLMAKTLLHGPNYLALICLGIVLTATPLLAQSADPTIKLASDTSWQVYGVDPATPGVTSLGNAQKFCLNFSSPQSCPNGAILYGNPAGGGWSADRSSIPDAYWIWAPNVTGNTTKADLKSYWFTKTLELSASPSKATISIAVDDYAKVYVNGTASANLAGEYGSITDVQKALAAQSALTTINIASLLHPGTNTITVFAQNGPSTFNGCNQCRYSQNSAGVVFGGTIEFGSGTSLPTDRLGFTGQWNGFGNYEVRFPWHLSSVPQTLVNTLNGNQVLAYRDLALPGDGLRFNFIRVYNSLDPYSGPLGPGWTHTYNVFLRAGASGVILLKEADGRDVSFSTTNGILYTPLTKGVFDKLEKSSGSFILTRKNHNKLYFSLLGKLTSIADENNRTLTCSYTGDNLTQIVDPENRLFSFAYVDNHLVSITDPSGRMLKYEYYPSGRLHYYIDPLQGRTEFQYDLSTGQLSIAIQPNGVHSIENTYNQGRVISQKNPADGLTTVTNYNSPWPNAARSLAATTCQTAMCAEAEAPCTATTFTNPRGAATTHVYDKESRLIRIVDALGGITGYGYDENNNRTSVTDPLCNTATYVYDSYGNLTNVMDAGGGVSIFTYDTNHEDLLKSTNGRGTTIQYTYDGSHNRTSETDALGNVTRFSYDGRGYLIQMTDANGHITSYEYDLKGSLVKVTDAKGNITKYAYDDIGNRTSVTNAKGKTTLYSYNNLHRLLRVSDPLGHLTSYTYDGLGNLISVVDPIGHVTNYTYTGLNRVASANYSGETAIQYTYDPVGNRLTMADSRGTTSYSYDSLNQLVCVTQPNGSKVQYTYDAAGNRTSVQYPDGKTVVYSFDKTNRMATVMDWSSRAARYTYDGAGHVTLIDNPNGTSSTFQFDGADRLTQISNWFRGSDQNSIPLRNYQYVLDPVGNRTMVTDGNGQSISYGYDALDQLVMVTSGNDIASYSYDPNGNRTALNAKRSNVAYDYDDADRLKRAGDTIFTYDAAGNRIGKTSGGITTSYVYDTANRLTKVAAGQSINTFEYDGDGNRVAQVVPGGGRYEYVNDTAGRLAMVLQESGPDGVISYLHGRDLISESGPGFDYYYLFDLLRSTIGLTDSSGRRTQRYLFDTWGETVTSIPSPGVGTRNKYQFTGEALDPGTGLYFLRSRYYEPETGRFLTKDPSSGSWLIPLSLNPYIYVRNNPLRYVDPSGRDDEPPWGDPPPPPGPGEWVWPFAPDWP